MRWVPVNNYKYNVEFSTESLLHMGSNTKTTIRKLFQVNFVNCSDIHDRNTNYTDTRILCYHYVQNILSSHVLS
jgi:hypothetical protein